MISGFVISYTLDNTPNLLSFYKNRFIRLFPAMLLCSLITFAVDSWVDVHHLFGHALEIKNFLPSLTFINPNLWKLITGIDFHWLNGSYWSLWVEVQFYVIASAVYFLNKSNFFRNMLLVGIAVGIAKYIPINLLGKQQLYKLLPVLTAWHYGNEIFNITFYITWFLPGVVFYQLYKGINIKEYPFILVCCIIMLCYLVRDTQVFFSTAFYQTLLGCLLMFTLFLLMIYRKRYLRLLENSFLSRIGVISYSIYLIHENTGILLMNKYGKYMGVWSPVSPLIVIVLVIGFAWLSYRFYEKKVSIFLKRKFANLGRKRVDPLYKEQ
jgi:peptidoglycan/LPS O-acetylase OafA/YrhL